MIRALSKRKCLEKLLSSSTVYVYINPDRKNLVLPAELFTQPNITIQISYEFEGEITLSKDSLEAYLLFGSTYTKCTVPYEAIWGLGNTEKIVYTWEQDIPVAILPLLASQQLDTGELKDVEMSKSNISVEKKPARNPNVKKVIGQTTIKSNEQKKEKPSGSHLRRIK